MAAKSTIDKREIEHFAKDSSHWWDEEGPFKPLHKLNPVRLAYIRDQICQHFDCDKNSLTPFKKLKVLDVGCGGGLVCEPMARMGGNVTGVDADENAIHVAKEHALGSDLDIKYKCQSAEELLEQNKEHFDVVLALEIIEHVNDVDNFVDNCLKLCAKGGLVIFSTLNRTPKSYALGIVAAEHILGWVPKGTHQWKKFVRPSELSKSITKANGTSKDIKGLIFNPLKNKFMISDKDIDVNYFITAGKQT